ncbi:MAG: TonB-dependent receptor [Gallionellaceae bacterium]|nr:TonB-dependent receptor [Gallionellaceae bacterium]
MAGQPWAIAAVALALLAPPGHAGDAEDSNVTLISAADLARERPADLVSLLRAKAGLNDSGGSLSLRGVKGVAIHIDGFAATFSDLRQLAPERVASIEILRGAASARFGADAMGGAIAVLTKGADAAPALEVSLGADSAGGAQARLSGARAAGAASLALTGEVERVVGWRRVPAAPYPSSITVADEGSRHARVDARLAWTGAAGDLAVNLEREDAHYGYGRPNWWEDYRADRLRLAAGRRSGWAERVDFALVWEDWDDRGLKDRGSGTDAAGLAPEHTVLSRGTRIEADLTARFGGEASGLTLGLHLGRNRDRYDIRPWDGGADLFALSADTVNVAGHFLWRRPLGDTAGMELSGRHDHYRYADTRIHNPASSPPDSVGPATGLDTFNPKLGLHWNPGPATRLNASLGTGFVPPTADQLHYSETTPGSRFLANPSLQPQRSVTADLGLSHRFKTGGEAGLTLFRTLWRDKIGVMIVDYADLARQYRNLGEAESTGIEAQWQGPLATGWTLSANYTYTASRITADAGDPGLVGNELPDTPRHKLNLALDYEHPGRLSSKALLRCVGASYMDERNTVVDSNGYRWRRAPYCVVDLSLVRRLAGWNLTVAVDNLFDRHYESGFFWQDRGRLVRIEVAARFD